MVHVQCRSLVGPSMTADASSKKLRLGVMCQGAVLERWQAEAIERMLDGGHVELVLLIVDSPQNYAKRGIWEKLRAAGGSKFLFNLYLRTLCRPKSRRPKDLSQLFAD